MTTKRFSLAITLLAFSLSSIAVAAHDEGVDGDLSTDPNNPTAVSFSVGSNIVTGTMQASGDTRDYLTFTLGPAQTLTALLQLDYTDVASGGGGDRGFHAIIAGSSSFVPSGGTIGSFLGSDHLDPLAPGTDMLPSLAAAPTGGSGFAVPLGPGGTYTYHVQQTGPELTAYSLDFVVVPEPASLLLLGSMSLPLVLVRRRA